MTVTQVDWIFKYYGSNFEVTILEKVVILALLDIFISAYIFKVKSVKAGMHVLLGRLCDTSFVLSTFSHVAGSGSTF